MGIPARLALAPAPELAPAELPAGASGRTPAPGARAGQATMERKIADKAAAKGEHTERIIVVPPGR